MTSKVARKVCPGRASLLGSGSDGLLHMTETRVARRFSNKPCATGFAYVLLLVSIAVIGLVASAALSVGAQIGRRDAEQSLLTIGTEFDAALRSYAGVPASAITPTVARGPRILEDLLKDPRSPAIRRHLRQVYADPLTGSSNWGLVRDSAGFIVGVYSLADGEPIKRSGFEPKWSGFEDAKGYNDWVFGLPTASGGKRSEFVPISRTP